jgi:hypothetical protein
MVLINAGSVCSQIEKSHHTQHALLVDFALLDTWKIETVACYTW